MEIVDFAKPFMAAQTALKNMHAAVLRREYDEALKLAQEAIVETKLAYNAVLNEKEKERG